MRVTRTSVLSQSAMIFGLILLTGLVAAPWWAGRADLRLLGEIFLYASLATLWNLLAGYAGLVSVGQQAYVGLGGYAFFALTMLFGVPIYLALPLAGIAGAIIAAPVAVLIFRLRGAYLAIGTWVVAEVFRLTAAQTPALGGGSGTSLPADIARTLADGHDAREAFAYWLALGTLVIVLGTAFAVLRSG